MLAFLTNALSLLALTGMGAAEINAVAAATGQNVVGDTVDPVSKLTWNTIACPPNEFAVGVTERQGGWTAQIQVLCALPTAGGGWAQDVAGGEAGGPHGDHSATLLCGRNAWITGIAGQMVTAYYNDVTHEQTEHYLANPVIYCGNTANPALQTLSDQNFKPQGGSGLYATTYRDSPAVYCPAGTYASGARAAIGQFRNPDIQAIQLNCATAPGAATPKPPLPPKTIAPVRR